MLFVGDIALPDGITPTVDNIFTFRNVIANLEGCISSKTMAKLNERKVFSNDNVIDFLLSMGVVGVTLANNHITDVPEAFERTKELLGRNKIKYTGAGYSYDEACQPIVIDENGLKYIILSFGWDVISCKYVKDGVLGINPLKEVNILSSIDRYQNEYRDARIIVVPHWDYELERYPMPMQRELAKRIIDAGAFAIMGHHPHCVQDIEVYKNHVICYSLGNWFIPEGVYIGGKLVFPSYTYDEMAVKLEKETFTVYKYMYIPQNNRLIYRESETYGYGGATPACEFSGMNDREYRAWFRTKRVKKKFLPVFFGYDSDVLNRAKAEYVILRQKVLIAMMKIKSG